MTLDLSGWALIVFLVFAFWAALLALMLALCAAAGRAERRLEEFARERRLRALADRQRADAEALEEIWRLPTVER